MKTILSLVPICLAVGLLSACSSTTDLSNAAPYHDYAGKTVVLVHSMPVKVGGKGGSPSELVPLGSRVTIKRVYLEKKVTPPSASTEILATVEYTDPVSNAPATWNYPLGFKNGPVGYTEQIIVAPWEPDSTPPLRYVGKSGKDFGKPATGS